MTKVTECHFLMDLQKAQNEFEWVKFLIDIDYMMNNKIELIGEPD